LCHFDVPYLDVTHDDVPYLNLTHGHRLRRYWLSAGVADDNIGLRLAPLVTGATLGVGR